MDSPVRPTSQPTPDQRLVFRRRHRLSGGAAFQAVFNERIRRSHGPVSIACRASGEGEHRLGLSVSRKFGNAVARHRFKRLIREAFRLERPGFPEAPGGGGYDVVVMARPHDLWALETYRATLADLVRQADAVCRRRHSDENPGKHPGTGKERRTKRGGAS